MNFGRILLAGLLAAGAGFAGAAQAQDYPNQPIRFIVPFAPGGGTDTVARLVAQELSKTIGQQVVVENHGGGGTIIGTEIAVNAPPDGYTIMLGSTTLGINPALRDDLPYDTLEALEPVSMLSSIPYALTAHPSAGVTTVEELIAKAKAEPGALNYGSPGIGSGGHLASELFQSLTGVELTHIPYSGSGPALTDLLGGRIDLLFGTMVAALPHVQSGALVALAVSTKERADVLPDVPTIGESGVPDYVAASWNGVLVPTGTPQEIIDKLNAEIVAALESDAVTEAMAQDGAVPTPTTPEEFRTFLEGEIAKWTKVVDGAGIEAQ